MAKTRVGYRGNSVQGYSIPGIRFAQYSSLTSGLNDMNRKLDRLSSFATNELDKAMLEEGKKYGAENPLSLEQFLDANPAEKNKMFKGNSVTTKGKAIKAAQVATLSTNMVIDAQSKFAALKEIAYKTDMDLETYQLQLNAITEGYADSLISVDADASIATKAKLASTANSYFTAYSDKKIKDFVNQKKTVALIYGQEKIKEIADIVKGGDLYVGVDHDDDDSYEIRTVDQILDARKLQVIGELNNQNVSSEKIAEWSNKWDDEVIKSKQNVLYDYVNQDENKVDGTTITKYFEEADKGNFENNDRLKKIDNSLPQDKKKEFHDKLDEWKDDAYKDLTEKEEMLEFDTKDDQDDLQTKYYTAKREGNFTLAKSLVEEAKIYDKLYKELSEDFRQAENDATFDNRDTVAILNDSLVQGTLTISEIKQAHRDLKLSAKTKYALIEKVITQKDTKWKAADAYMRKSFGYPDLDMAAFAEEAPVAYNKYRKKSLELYDYMLDNPELTAKDIMEKARELSEDVATDTEKKNEELITKNKLTNTQGKFGFKKQVFINYLKENVSVDKIPKIQELTKYNFNDIMLSTDEDIDDFISVLEEIKNIEVKKGLFVIDVVRPLDLTDATLDAAIKELNYLKTINNEAPQ